MKAIILAAGAGRRLGASGPKCMIDVAGASIIHRQIAAFQAAGVTEFVIVVGYRDVEVREHLAAFPGSFTFIVNPRYAETNTIYSLFLAREHLDGPCWYANGDVVFDERLTRRLRAPGGGAELAVVRGRCGDEEVKVVVEGGRIVRIGKVLPPEACLGEFVGVARFGEPASRALAASLAECVERQGVVADYFERALDMICSDHELVPVDVSDLPCHEIDFPEDLAHVLEDIAPRLLPLSAT